MNEEFQISTKHIPLRIAVFAIAVLVAVVAITKGVTAIGKQEPGYSVVDLDNDEELPFYFSGVSLNYCFTGEGKSIREEKNLVRMTYGNALKNAYKQLDAQNVYEGINNLATLNQNPGQAFELSPELYAVLRDAWAKTQEQRGYSVFAGALYAEWNSVLSLAEPEDFDPLRDEDEARRLRAIAEATAELSSFSLDFLDDERHLVRFTVADSYRSLLKELEQEAPVLDLNLLREAYELQMVARELEAAGFARGYLSTVGGLTLALSGQDDGQYVLYGCIEDKPAPAATIPVTPGSACSLLRSFALAEGEVCYYVIDGLARYPGFPSDGEHRQLLASSCVCSAEGELVEACYRNIQLQTCRDGEQLRQTAAESGLLVAWTLRGDGEKRVYTLGGSGIEAASDYGFSLIDVF